jgi:hypothetical protein
LSFKQLWKYNLTYYYRKIKVCRQLFLIPSGYSVSSGKFLGAEKKTYYVSGAPRAGVKYQGKVISELHEVTAPLSSSIHLLSDVSTYCCILPVTVFARSEAGIVGSNPTQGMDV